jgi:acarbose 7IV-phosphotransferase
MIDRGKRLAVCTMAADGAIALDAHGQRYEAPALPGVDVVDSNGAGDAFFAGVLFGVLEGVPLAIASRYGSVAGALAVTSSELASTDPSAERLRAERI